MKLSIIIIEYHCMHHVVNCVSSIRSHLANIDTECIVISNSEYQDEEIQRYEHDVPGVSIINTGKNLGYAGGVNAGISHASGDYLYVVNPDCLLTDGNIINVISDMEAEPDWAISGPKVVDGENTIQPSCRRFPRPWTFLLVRSFLSQFPGAGAETKRYLMADFDRSTIKEVDWVSGGATLVKASCIKDIGGMDERYFLYMEDVDWCHTCWSKGFKVKYTPGSVVMHAGQHESIKGNIIQKLRSKHLRMHLTSLFKYFLKWRLS